MITNQWRDFIANGIWVDHTKKLGLREGTKLIDSGAGITIEDDIGLKILFAKIKKWDGSRELLVSVAIMDGDKLADWFAEKLQYLPKAKATTQAMDYFNKTIQKRALKHLKRISGIEDFYFPTVMKQVQTPAGTAVTTAVNWNVIESFMEME